MELSYSSIALYMFEKRHTKIRVVKDNEYEILGFPLKASGSLIKHTRKLPMKLMVMGLCNLNCSRKYIAIICILAINIFTPQVYLVVMSVKSEASC